MKHFPRCIHGVYDPFADGEPCSICNPRVRQVGPKMVARFVSETGRGDRPYANVNHAPGSLCPKCGCDVHYENKMTKQWICPECKTTWRGRADVVAA